MATENLMRSFYIPTISGIKEFVPFVPQRQKETERLGMCVTKTLVLFGCVSKLYITMLLLNFKRLKISHKLINEKAIGPNFQKNCLKVCFEVN